jgi:hypothetical protein
VESSKLRHFNSFDFSPYEMKQLRSTLEKRNAPEEGQKRGCCGSTKLAIVVVRRSWREISLWKTETLIQHMKNSLTFVSTVSMSLTRAESDP